MISSLDSSDEDLPFLFGSRIDVTEGDDGVATLEFERGRHNYFPSALTNDIKGEPYANSCERIDRIQP